MVEQEIYLLILLIIKKSIEGQLWAFKVTTYYVFKIKKEINQLYKKISRK